MSVLGLLRGIGIIVFIVALAGVIAYIGDRVGHQIGRKRLTLFNIRPRYTSTIVAVATGMIIALIITLVAIFASNQVQTAFFRLNEINAEIAKAQATAKELERKVNEGHVVIPVDEVMGSGYMPIPQNSPSGTRRVLVGEFYDQTVKYVDAVYTRPPYNLKRFEPPPNVGKALDTIANEPKMEAWVAQGPVLLIATAGQNLYEHDPIHFAITAFPDRLVVHGGQPIATLAIPAGKNVSAGVALLELLDGALPRRMVQFGMPPYFATNVLVGKMLPDQAQMDSMLHGGSGTYLLTAFASQNIYVHTFAVPIVVTLQKLPPR
jgi:hypothetical protein